MDQATIDRTPSTAAAASGGNTGSTETVELIYTELTCCGVPYGYMDQFGKEYDLDKKLKPESEQLKGVGSDQVGDA